MLSKSDLILILTELGEDQNIDTTSMVADIVTAKKVPLDILKFINDNRQLDVTQFYTHIRKSYNQKRSKLYINIMREITDVNEALTTLASLNLQILLFGSKLEDKQMFYKHSRAEDITKVLTLYYQNYDLTNCLKLLRLIKADILAFETIQGKRDLEEEAI